MAIRSAFFPNAALAGTLERKHKNAKHFCVYGVSRGNRTLVAGTTTQSFATKLWTPRYFYTLIMMYQKTTVVAKINQFAINPSARADVKCNNHFFLPNSSPGRFAEFWGCNFRFFELKKTFISQKIAQSRVIMRT